MLETASAANAKNKNLDQGSKKIQLYDRNNKSQYKKVVKQ